MQSLGVACKQVPEQHCAWLRKVKRPVGEFLSLSWDSSYRLFATQ